LVSEIELFRLIFWHFISLTERPKLYHKSTFSKVLSSFNSGVDRSDEIYFLPIFYLLLKFFGLLLVQIVFMLRSLDKISVTVSLPIFTSSLTSRQVIKDYFLPFQSQVYILISFWSCLMARFCYLQFFPPTLRSFILHVLLICSFLLL
jgi:hypothetical protein